MALTPALARSPLLASLITLVSTKYVTSGVNWRWPGAGHRLRQASGAGLIPQRPDAVHAAGWLLGQRGTQCCELGQQITQAAAGGATAVASATFSWP